VNTKIKDILDTQENIYLNCLIDELGLDKGIEMAHIMSVVNFKVDMFKNYNGGRSSLSIGDLYMNNYKNTEVKNIFNTESDFISSKGLYKIISKIYNYKKNEERDTEKIAYEKFYNKFLNSLVTMEYNDYLSTKHWRHFREEALKFYNNKCQLCGNSDESLHLHHNNYKNRGRETFNDVTLLCSSCHEKFHKEGE